MSEPTHETVFVPNFGGPRDVALHMTVRGKDAEVALAIGTGWDGTLPYRGEFVEFHSKTPMWDGHNATDATECPRGWDECFIDIRDSLGREGAEKLRNEGSEVVWLWLDEFWQDKFGGAA